MDYRSNASALALFYSLLLCLICTGCSKNDGRVAVYAVTGTVVVNGQPAEGARVVFYPTVAEVGGTQMPTPAGIVDATGKYQLESFEPGDGAPAGDYKVTVVWPEPPPANGEHLGIFDQKDRLRDRYNDPAKSGLTATVPEGGGEIPPIELK